MSRHLIFLSIALCLGMFFFVPETSSQFVKKWRSLPRRGQQNDIKELNGGRLVGARTVASVERTALNLVALASKSKRSLAEMPRKRSDSDDSESSSLLQKLMSLRSLFLSRIRTAAASNLTIQEDQGAKESQTPKLQNQRAIKTRVGIVTEHFKFVYDVKSGQIDMAQLLQALHCLKALLADIGQHQSARELSRNLEKAEAFVNRHGTARGGESSMEQVLLLEKTLDTHKYCPLQGQLIALEDPSCAMALLWIRRSLKFLYHVFQSLTQNMDVALGTVLAYEQSLLPYHDWVLQKIYRLAIRAVTPSNEEYWARLGGFPVKTFGAAEEDATRRDLQELLTIWGPLLQRWEQVYAELDLEDRRRI